MKFIKHGIFKFSYPEVLSDNFVQEDTKRLLANDVTADNVNAG